MSDPFLSLPGTKRKRPSRPDKRTPRPDKSQPSKSRTKNKRRLRDTSPQSEDKDEIGPGGIGSDDDIQLDEPDESDDSDHGETPAERRLRLAKDYLDKVRVETGTSILISRD
jgi:ribosomal RNA-processing protein 9